MRPRATYCTRRGVLFPSTSLVSFADWQHGQQAHVTASHAPSDVHLTRWCLRDCEMTNCVFLGDATLSALDLSFQVRGTVTANVTPLPYPAHFITNRNKHPHPLLRTARAIGSEATGKVHSPTLTTFYPLHTYTSWQGHCLLSTLLTEHPCRRIIHFVTAMTKFWCFTALHIYQAVIRTLLVCILTGSPRISGPTSTHEERGISQCQGPSQRHKTKVWWALFHNTRTRHLAVCTHVGGNQCHYH